MQQTWFLRWVVAGMVVWIIALVIGTAMLNGRGAYSGRKPANPVRAVRPDTQPTPHVPFGTGAPSSRPALSS